MDIDQGLADQVDVRPLVGVQTDAELVLGLHVRVGPLPGADTIPAWSVGLAGPKVRPASDARVTADCDTSEGRLKRRGTREPSCWPFPPILMKWAAATETRSGSPSAVPKGHDRARGSCSRGRDGSVWRTLEVLISVAGTTRLNASVNPSLMAAGLPSDPDEREMNVLAGA